MASNDFFLNFGSNAQTWAKGLSGELRPATSSINELTTALERYDSAVKQRKGTNSPLDSLFTRLDSVSDKFADLTGTLANTFNQAIQSINLLQEDIAGLLRSVKSVTSEASTGRRRGRPNLTQVDERDAASAAQVRNTETARKALDSAVAKIERLGRVNETLASRLETTGDKTIILRREIEDLGTATKDATGGIETLETKIRHLGEVANGVVINAPGGAHHPGTPGVPVVADLAPVMSAFVEAIRGITLTVSQQNAGAARIASQAEIANKAVADSALETQRYTAAAQVAEERRMAEVTLPGKKRGTTYTKMVEVLDDRQHEQAQRGTYSLGGKPVSFRDIVQGESFEQNMQRTAELKARFNQLQLPQAADFEHGQLFQRLSDVFFQTGGSSAHAVTRAQKHGDSASLIDSIKASRLTNIGAQSKGDLEQLAALGMTPQQGVERALRFTTAREHPDVTGYTLPGELPEARQRIIDDWIAQELRANPHQTFQATGSKEVLSRVKALDEQVLAAGGRVEVGDNGKSYNVPPQGGIPEVLQGIPEQELWAGAYRRRAIADENKQAYEDVATKESARKEAARRKSDPFYREYGVENDTTLSRERLSSKYSPTTQLNRLKENVEDAKAMLANEQKAGQEIGIHNEALEAKYREAVRVAQARLEKEGPALQAEIDAKKKATAASVESSREIAARHDAVTKHTREAQQFIKNLPSLLNAQGKGGAIKDVPEVLSDAEVRSQLGIRRKTVKTKVDPAAQAALEAKIASSQDLLQSLESDPDAFIQRAVTGHRKLQEIERARALEEQRARTAELDQRLNAYQAKPPKTKKQQAEFLALLEERRAGVPVQERPVQEGPETRFANWTASGEIRGVKTASEIRGILTSEIQRTKEELESLGTRQTTPKITDKQRAEAREQMLAHRQEVLAPLLESHGLSPKEAAKVSRGTNEQIAAALLSAAARLDEAAAAQQAAADKAEAVQDTADGFDNTPAQQRVKGKKGKKGKRKIAPTAADVMGEDEESTPAATKLESLQAQHAESLARKRAANAALKEANERGAGTEELRAANREANRAHRALNQKINAAANNVAEERTATKASTGGGGGGGGRRKPPTGGGPVPPDDGNDESGDRPTRRPSAAARSNDKFLNEQLLKNFAQFGPQVQQAIREAVASAGIQQGATSLTDAQKAALLPALHQFRADPAYAKLDAQSARRTFAAGAGLQLQGSLANQRFLIDSFNLNRPQRGSTEATRSANALNSSLERQARLEEIMTVQHVKTREALLARLAAEERLAAVMANPASTPGQIARAQRQLSVADRTVRRANEERLAPEQPQGLNALLAQGGRQALRFASFQIAFEGLEKVRELVDSGLQAQMAFVRLQSNLEATGRAGKEALADLNTALGDISTDTAQPFEHTVQAAAELTGVLKTQEDLIEGSRVASELANITHGTLTAHEAAVGLRDVTDAYGLKGVKAIRAVGDEVTRISQVTGVSVEDVIDGTTQLAQEARHFGMSQRQAAVMAAEVTKNTGETGEAAAEQVSRILSTVNNQKVQQLLERTVNPKTGKPVATMEDFAGKMVDGHLVSGAGDVLTKLLNQYDDLEPQQRAAIDALAGAGRQARALTGLLRDSASTADLLLQVTRDTGALADQNAKVLNTIGGSFQQLGANFKRLGKDMIDAGFFDAIGLVVRVLDDVMMTIDKVIRTISGLADQNPMTKWLLHLGLILGELTLAWKVFGGAVTGATAKTLGFMGASGAAAAVRGGTVVQSARSQVVGIPGRVSSFFAPTAAQVQAPWLSQAYRNGIITRGEFNQQIAPMLTPAQRRQVAANERAARRILPAGSPVPAGEGRWRDPATGRYTTAPPVVTGGAMDRAAVSARTAAANLGTLAKSIGGVAASAAGIVGPLLLLSYVMNEVGKVSEYNANIQKKRRSIEEFLNPDQDYDHGPLTHAKQSFNDAEEITKAVLAKGRPGEGGTLGPANLLFGNQLKFLTGKSLPDNFNPSWGQMWQTGVDFLQGNTSGGNTSKEFDEGYNDLLARSQERLEAAILTGDPEELIEAQKRMDEDIAKHAEELIKSAGDKDAQAMAAAALNFLKVTMDDAAQGRAKTMAGIADFDQLTLQQLENAQTFISTISKFDSRTLRLDPEATRIAREDTGVTEGSAIGKLMARLGTDTTMERVRDMIEIGKLELPQMDLAIEAKGLGDPDRDRLVKARDATLMNLQQQMALLDQMAVGNPQALSDLLAKVGNLEGSRAALQQSNAAIREIVSTLDADDPRYFQYLNQLVENENHLALSGVQKGIDAAQMDSSKTLDPARQARNRQQEAQLRLQAARQAQARISAQFAQRATDDLREIERAKREAAVYENRPRTYGGNQAGMFSDRAYELPQENQGAYAKAKADQQIAENNLEANKKLAAAGDPAAAEAVKAAQIAVNQANLSAAQAMQTQATSAYDLKAAFAANAGNNIDAARANLQKANSDLKFAVANYGANSAEANNARIAAINANAAIQQAIDDRLNAALDLEISMLSNRGNDHDKQRILSDRVQQAQNNLNAFTAKGGNLDSAEGMRLTAQVNDAKRTRTDQGVQIQIDTLDYMRETFQISTAAEIKALQDILKNKQLTQDRVRQINLQIRQLAQQISGQFNIGEILVPTLYQARRSVQGGYNNAPTTQAIGTAFAQSSGQVVNSNNTSNTTNLTVNGADFAKVMAYIKTALGTTASTRIGTTTGKGV